jgi:hypothetical protein
MEATIQSPISGNPITGGSAPFNHAGLKERIVPIKTMFGNSSLKTNLLIGCLIVTITLFVSYFFRSRPDAIVSKKRKEEDQIKVKTINTSTDGPVVKEALTKNKSKAELIDEHIAMMQINYIKTLKELNAFFKYLSDLSHTPPAGISEGDLTSFMAKVQENGILKEKTYSAAFETIQSAWKNRKLAKTKCIYQCRIAINKVKKKILSSEQQSMELVESIKSACTNGDTARVGNLQKEVLNLQAPTQEKMIKLRALEKELALEYIKRIKIAEDLLPVEVSTVEHHVTMERIKTLEKELKLTLQGAITAREAIYNALCSPGNKKAERINAKEKELIINAFWDKCKEIARIATKKNYVEQKRILKRKNLNDQLEKVIAKKQYAAKELEIIDSKIEEAQSGKAPMSTEELIKLQNSLKQYDATYLRAIKGEQNVYIKILNINMQIHRIHLKRIAFERGV